MKMKRFIVGIVLFAVAMGIQASERKKYNFNSDWLLKIGDMERAESPKYADGDWEKVTLPQR